MAKLNEELDRKQITFDMTVLQHQQALEDLKVCMVFLTMMKR